MIRSIRFKFGRASGLVPVTVETTPITVFVGPNNSGKSKVLSELNHYCTGGQKDANDVILESIEFDAFSPADAEEKVRQVTLRCRSARMALQPHLSPLYGHIILIFRAIFG